MTEQVLGNSFDVNFGLSGLAKWARLADAAGRDGWPKLSGQNGVWRAISHWAASGTLTYEQLVREVPSIVQVETDGLGALADALR